jgi:hypothetical protein
MTERKFDEIITDEASAEAWQHAMQTEAQELSERAKNIVLESFLPNSELVHFYDRLASINYLHPDDFLRTRILQFLETKKDPRVREGLLQYIKDDIDLLEMGFN